MSDYSYKGMIKRLQARIDSADVPDEHKKTLAVLQKQLRDQTISPYHTDVLNGESKYMSLRELGSRLISAARGRKKVSNAEHERAVNKMMGRTQIIGAKARMIKLDRQRKQK